MGLFGPPDVEKMKVKRDVKGLIKALGYRKYKWVRERAARALGQIGEARAVAPLLTALRDSSRDVCQTAAEALVKIGCASPK
jgi:HEAT repeat protein